MNSAKNKKMKLWEILFGRRMTLRMHVLLLFMSTVPLASPSYAGLQERSEAVDDGKDLLTW